MRVYSPIGILELCVDGRGRVYALRFASECAAEVAGDGVGDGDGDGDGVGDGDGEEVIAESEQKACAQLQQYFFGTRKAFSLPLAFSGSEFCMRVWKEMQRIKYGERVSYSALAALIGAPKAVRATAHAVAINPMPVLIPCHRIVRQDGSVGEYALHTLGMEGREIKRYLLDLES